MLDWLPFFMLSQIALINIAVIYAEVLYLLFCKRYQKVLIFYPRNYSRVTQENKSPSKELNTLKKLS